MWDISILTQWNGKRCVRRDFHANQNAILFQELSNSIPRERFNQHTLSVTLGEEDAKMQRQREYEFYSDVKKQRQMKCHNIMCECKLCRQDTF